MAGVSAATVSRFFNAPGKLSAETAARIKGAVDELGYTPNLIAGGLASNRSRLVAALAPSIEQSIFAATVQAMTDELAGAGYSVMLGLTGTRDEHVERQLSAVLGRRPDGVILTGSITDPVMRQRLVAQNTPIIETWDLPVDPIDMVVGFSHDAVGRAVASRVIGKGWQKPLLISASGTRAAIRQAGFTEALRQQGRPEPEALTFTGVTTVGQGRRSFAQAWETGARPDVVVCSSDWTAYGVIAEAQSRGLDVPGDLAVIGFGDLDFSADVNPSLTTVRIDGHAIGRQAVSFLLQRARGERVAEPIVDVGFELVVRKSG
ncbi:LacI family DNA-binding transcriptional regulator [soil metagenome]